MSKANFFTQVDEDRKAFIDKMSTPREEVEAPDFDIPGLDDDEDQSEEKPGSSQSGEDNEFSLEYNSSQLWTAELTLLKVDEFMAMLLAAFTGQKSDKYRRRESASLGKEDREAQLLAAIFNKYQMRMSIEYAFLSLFVMSYAPIFITAYQDLQDKKKRPKRVQHEAEDLRKKAKGTIE
ncbi:MAG TPA: hypothetical protein VJ953_18480 [Saprospiraceae bacterium]|nr:hypothetical protein [Saprospiraceae bacterium]